MLKKLIAVIIAVLTVFALVSCGGNGDAETTGIASSAPDSETATAAVTADGTAADTEEPAELLITPEEYDPEAVVATCGAYTITEADAAFLFQMNYQEFAIYVMQGGYDPSMLGLDLSASLRNQECTIDPNCETWFDYVLGSVTASLNEMLSFCAAFDDAGGKLDEDDLKVIDDTIASVTKSIGDMELSEAIAPGVTEDNVRNVVTISYVAAKHLNSELDKLDVSDKALEEAFEQHKSEYETVDILSYVFDYHDLLGEDDSSEEADDEAIVAAKKQCASYAIELAAVKDETAFLEYVTTNMTDVLGLTDDEAASQCSRLRSTGVSRIAGVTDWAFDAEDGTTRKTEDDDGCITVEMVTAHHDADNSNTICTVRHILFKHETYENDEKVREIYDKWVKDGAKIEDFEALAEEYSEDPGSAENGGLYEDMDVTNTVPEFREWCANPERKAGDYDLIESEAYGWHIMYFESGEPQWKSDMRNMIRSNKYYELTDEISKAFKVEINEENLGNIPA
ncbi:MAG: peptidylprolyl isomerase [Clostridia bacterium]|nr:peptidylprolyl isomerase [Clostridia bacterium]